MTNWILIIFIHQAAVVVPGSYADQAACLASAQSSVMLGANSTDAVEKKRPLEFKVGVAAICVPAGDMPSP